MTIRKLALIALTLSAALVGTASVATAGGVGVVSIPTVPTTVTAWPGPVLKSGPSLTQPRTYAVECRVKGDNFFIINWGNDNLDAGRQIAWSSPTTGDGGVIPLPKTLGPGDQVKLAEVLSAPVLPGARCDVGLA